MPGARPVRIRVYAGYFGFRELPFNNTPDPRFFYSTPDHEEALASLIYGVKERKGFVLLTGEVGAGKTLVTRMMLRHFGARLAFATLNHAVQSPEDLMESICTEFELPVRSRMSATELVRVFHDFLLAQFAQNVPVVLVLDEAQNLPAERFEQLRTIGNLEADDAKLLQVAIVGQPELQQMFLSPELCQLRQRIFRSFHLPALSREDTEGYIRHRLSVVADSQMDIFEKSAIEAIYSFSGGLPRIINTVCDNALLSAYSADRPTIAGDFVESVIAQMMIVGKPDRRHASTLQDTEVGSPRLVSTLPGWRRTQPENIPESQCDTAEARLQTEMLLRRMENTAQRVQTVETLVRKQPSIHEVIERVKTASLHDEKTRVVQLELAKLERKVHSKADETNRHHDESERRLAALEQSLGALEQRLGAIDPRIGTLEQRLGELDPRLGALEKRLDDAIGDLAEARTIHARLGSVVEQSQSIVGRGEDVSRQMEQRHRELRKLAATVNGVVRDLRHLLVRANETATKTGRAENRAQTIHNRLLSQSKRSSRLAEELARIVNRSHAVGPALSRRMSEVKPPRKKTALPHVVAVRDATTAIEPPHGSPAAGPPLRADVERPKKESHSVHEDRVHPRDPTPGDNNGGNASRNDCADRATNRLAHRVDNLLELIGTTNNPSG